MAFWNKKEKVKEENYQIDSSLYEKYYESMRERAKQAMLQRQELLGQQQQYMYNTGTLAASNPRVVTTMSNGSDGGVYSQNYTPNNTTLNSLLEYEVLQCKNGIALYNRERDQTIRIVGDRTETITYNSKIENTSLGTLRELLEYVCNKTSED